MYNIPRSEKRTYRVLKKFGIPPKMLQVIINLHSDLIVKIKSGGTDVCIGSTGGVKQGFQSLSSLSDLHAGGY